MQRRCLRRNQTRQVQQQKFSLIPASPSKKTPDCITRTGYSFAPILSTLGDSQARRTRSNHQLPRPPIAGPANLLPPSRPDPHRPGTSAGFFTVGPNVCPLAAILRRACGRWIATPWSCRSWVIAPLATGSSMGLTAARRCPQSPQPPDDRGPKLSPNHPQNPQQKSHPQGWLFVLH
jgi:hypothetical protein